MFAFAFAYGYAIAHGEVADGLDTSFHGIELHIENVAVVAGGGEFNQRNEQAAPIKVMAAEPYDIVGSVAVVFMARALWFVVVMGACGRCLFIGVKPSPNQVIECFLGLAARPAYTDWVSICKIVRNYTEFAYGFQS